MGCFLCFVRCKTRECWIRKVSNGLKQKGTCMDVTFAFLIEACKMPLFESPFLFPVRHQIAAIIKNECNKNMEFAISFYILATTYIRLTASVDTAFFLCVIWESNKPNDPRWVLSNRNINEIISPHNTMAQHVWSMHLFKWVACKWHKTFVATSWK